MTIHPEVHLEHVGSYLQGKRVLEVGCGDGYRSQQLAKFCNGLVGVDPDAAAIGEARAIRSVGSVDFQIANGESLPFGECSFGAVVFVLSLHHIPVESMPVAIDEAIRVAVPDAPIIFIEPGFRGSFFDLDSAVDACDGDERLQKAQAYAAILSHPGLQEVEEFWDLTRYSFTSTQDFMAEFEVSANHYDHVDSLLLEAGHRLNGERRINVCRKLG